MLKMNPRFQKLSLSLAAAIALSGGVARANPLPTSTDEARALQAKVRDFHASAELVSSPFGSTDEARALVGRSFASSSSSATGSTIVTSTDDARAVAGVDHPIPIEKERLLGSYAVANAAEQ